MRRSARQPSLYEWNWSKSGRELERAVAIDPNNAEVRYQHGIFLGSLQRLDAGIAEARRATELDPLSLQMRVGLGSILMAGRRYDEAIETLKRALELDPNVGSVHSFLGAAYLLSGRGNLAASEARRAIELGDPGGRTLLAAAYFASSRRADAIALMNQLTAEAKQGNAGQGPVQLARLFAGLGQTDRAFEWLEQGYREHDWTLPLLNVLPEVEPLHDDPRFKDLVRRIGIPER